MANPRIEYQRVLRDDVLCQRVAKRHRLASSKSMTVAKQVQSKLEKHPDLVFDIEQDDDLGAVNLHIESKHRDRGNDTAFTVSIYEEDNEASVSAHSYGDSSSHSEGPDNLPIDASRLTNEVEKLLKKYRAI